MNQSLFTQSTLIQYTYISEGGIIKKNLHIIQNT